MKNKTLTIKKEMYKHEEKAKDNKKRTVTNTLSRKKSEGEKVLVIGDNPTTHRSGIRTKRNKHKEQIQLWTDYTDVN